MVRLLCDATPNERVDIELSCLSCLWNYSFGAYHELTGCDDALGEEPALIASSWAVQFIHVLWT